jgi:hypothetical protein
MRFASDFSLRASAPAGPSEPYFLYGAAMGRGRKPLSAEKPKQIAQERARPQDRASRTSCTAQRRAEDVSRSQRKSRSEITEGLTLLGTLAPRLAMHSRACRPRSHRTPARVGQPGECAGPPLHSGRNAPSAAHGAGQQSRQLHLAAPGLRLPHARDQWIQVPERHVAWFASA